MTGRTPDTPHCRIPLYQIKAARERAAPARPRPAGDLRPASAGPAGNRLPCILRSSWQESWRRGGSVGYELHISRAEEYYDSAERPIALDEWLSYAESNSTLRVGGWLGWDEGRQPIYEYTCADGNVVSLTWFEGAIEIKGHFDGDAYREFGAVAENLQANLQGHHGERYTASGVLPPTR
ncbi:hypothetical protein ABZ754_00210 [Micromonospora purpureochromogenes]|uniref:hypothetical protein n=1 Tax=Micromonospora purpureochromogenes TaxID=47872 RepID=UPI0033DF6815